MNLNIIKIWLLEINSSKGIITRKILNTNRNILKIKEPNKNIEIKITIINKIISFTIITKKYKQFFKNLTNNQKLEHDNFFYNKNMCIYFYNLLQVYKFMDEVNKKFPFDTWVKVEGEF